MTGNMQNTVLIALIVVVAIFILYQYDSTLFGLLGRRYEGFEDKKAPKVDCTKDENKSKPECKPLIQKFTDMDSQQVGQPETDGSCPPGKKMVDGKCVETFADLSSFEGPSNFSSVQPPAGCYPRDQLTPSELLPLDQTSIYAQQNPMGPGSLKGKNFLSAGALIGVNTVGQSLRNANLQLRSEPPNPQVPVSIFLNSTITPDISHRPLEIGA